MANDITIVVSGGQEIADKLARLGNLYRSPSLRAVMEDIGQYYVDLAKADAPISRNPTANFSSMGTISAGLTYGGGLRGSIRYAVNNFGSLDANVNIRAGGPTAPYAAHVEFGTSDSMRIAVNRQVMFWMEDGAGRKIQVPWQLMAGQAALRSQGYMAKFRRIVWHPGTRAQPFFFKQLPIVLPRLLAALQRIILAEWNTANP